MQNVIHSDTMHRQTLVMQYLKIRPYVFDISSTVVMINHS